MTDRPVPSTAAEAFDRVRAAHAAQIAEAKRTALVDRSASDTALAVSLLRELRRAVELHFAIVDATHFLEYHEKLGDFLSEPPDDIAPWFVCAPKMHAATLSLNVGTFGTMLRVLTLGLRTGLPPTDSIVGTYSALTAFHEPFGLAPGAVLYLPSIVRDETGFVVATEALAEPAGAA